MASEMVWQRRQLEGVFRMPGRLSKSEQMARVRRNDTEPELVVRQFLFHQGFRFRKNDKRFPGTPDVVLPRHRALVFVHGCFWHGHIGCPRARLPATRRDFWANKIAANIERDRRVTEENEAHGWRVFVVWECDLKDPARRSMRLETLSSELRSGLS